MDRRRFGAWVVAAAAGGLVARVWAGFAIPVSQLGGDSEQFIDAAHRFTAEGLSGLTSRYPPVNQLYQGMVNRVFVGADGGGVAGLDEGRVHALAGALWVVPLVIGTALLGRRLGGRRMGAVAAVLVAASPMLIVISPRAMGEPIAAAVMPWLVLSALSFVDRPRWSTAGWMAVLLGVLGLTRAEMMALAALLPMVVGWRLRPSAIGEWRGAARAMAPLVLVVVVPVAMTATWSRYSASNLEFFSGERQVLGASSLGTTMLAGNCRASLATGPEMGWKNYPCIGIGDPSDPLVRRYQAREDPRALLGEDVADAGPVRVAGVSTLKMLRSVGLFQPQHTARAQAFLTPWPAGYFWVELVWGWVVLAAAGGGVVVLRRLHAALAVLAAPVLVVGATVFITFGNPRYRLSIEPLLLLAVAAALTSAWGSLRARAVKAGLGEGPPLPLR